MDKYRKCYFRIESGYVWGKGHDDKLNAKFNSEIKKLFAGWKIELPDNPSSCIRVRRDKENLYCHPMDLVGYIKETNIPEIEEMLKNGKTFKYNRVDAFDEAYSFTEQEFNDALRNADIETKILDAYTTKRKNLYKDVWPLLKLKSGVPFFDTTENKRKEEAYTRDTFDRLIQQGKIKESTGKNNTKIYRTVKNIGA